MFIDNVVQVVILSDISQEFRSEYSLRKEVTFLDFDKRLMTETFRCSCSESTCWPSASLILQLKSVTSSKSSPPLLFSSPPLLFLFSLLTPSPSPSLLLTFSQNSHLIESVRGRIALLKVATCSACQLATFALLCHPPPPPPSSFAS